MPTAEELVVRDRLLRCVRTALPILAALGLLLTVVALRGDDGEPALAAIDADRPAATVPDGPGSDGSTIGGAGDPAGAGPSASGGGGSSAGPSGAGGTARSGVACGPGARQVTWSAYAPWCTPAFSGDNGGATTPGVTRDTVTLSYRRQNTAQAAAVRALAGEATPEDGEFLHDLQVFANLFNQQFELYGRKVVLAPFEGRGDYLTEDLGQGQQAANADGITARELGAFIDVTFPSATSLFYSAALQSQGVIAYGFPFGTRRWYEANTPWQYNVFIGGSEWASWASNLVCQRLAGAPADFAGDPELRGKPRVFGLAAVEFPTWLAVADEAAANIERQCGVRMARRASYAENLGTMQRDGSSIAAQMKAAGVTTVICFCDPLMPIFLTDAASRQGFRPEWVAQNLYDPIAQVVDQSQWAHAVANGPASPPVERSEAYAAYKRADPNGEPASIYYQAAYEVLLHVFGALQTAGPVLTPATYQAGVFALPPSATPTDFGQWGGGAGRYTPIVSVPVVHWSPTTRGANGNPGSWVPCDEGRIYAVDDASMWGSGPLRCGS